MQLGNMNIRGGLCNVLRLNIEHIINYRLIKTTIANGEDKGGIVMMPKVIMQAADKSMLGFGCQRMQLSVRVAFTIDIHRSQGQII